jgi:TonB family protein
MHPALPLTEDVFTPGEVARAAGVPEGEVHAFLRPHGIRSYGRARLLPFADAVTVGRTLARHRPALPAAASPMFSATPGGARTARAPFAVSSVAHAAAVTTLVLATTLGLGPTTTLAVSRETRVPLRMVFLATPGPGGGGGGGGARQRVAPPKAERKGRHTMDSPLPVRQPPPEPEPIEAPRDPEPPKVEPEPLPPVEAPVASAPADERDHAGVLEETDARNESRGPGAGGGAGTGEGTGLGEGQGSGIGEGEGGGTGGGPYRPGSGIEPPSLLSEVKPDYTEQARQRGIEGDVVMEIVVRRDGSVGDVRVLQGLGYGLDERAVQAVRQWRFSPAHRRGAAVDVMVEVAMEFKIR